MRIAFSGIDGAGKSTQINLVQEEFLRNNEKAIVIWARGGYTPRINWVKKILRKSNASTIPQAGGKSNKRSQAFQKPMVRKVWLTLAIIDLFILYGIQVRWLQIKNYHIIFDRFLEDTLMDFKLNFPQENVKNWWIWKLLGSLVLSPSKHFVLLIPKEESQRRSILKNEPFPDSAEVLDKRIKLYKKLIKDSKKYIHINCMNEIKEVYREIKENLDK